MPILSQLYSAVAWMGREVRAVITHGRVGSAAQLASQGARYRAHIAPTSRRYADAALFAARLRGPAASAFLCDWYREFAMPGGADRDQLPLALVLNKRVAQPGASSRGALKHVVRLLDGSAVCADAPYCMWKTANAVADHFNVHADTCPAPQVVPPAVRKWPQLPAG